MPIVSIRRGLVFISAEMISGQSAGSAKSSKRSIGGKLLRMIRDAESRPFRWLNVHSPADIFSGRLDYFDPPAADRARAEQALPRPVDNVADEDALTLLAAHTEYWGGRAVFGPLYEELTR